MPDFPLEERKNKGGRGREGQLEKQREKRTRERKRKRARERKRERQLSQHGGDLTRKSRCFQITVATHSSTCDQHYRTSLELPIIPVQNKRGGRLLPPLAFDRFSTPPAFGRKSRALFSHRPRIDVERASATYFFLITDLSGERPVYME